MRPGYESEEDPVTGHDEANEEAGMRKAERMNRVVRGKRRGSMVVVLFVAIILGTLGIAAMTMSSSAARRDNFQARRENAFEVARAAAEEAVLLINNGKANVEITESMDTGSKQVEIEAAMLNEQTLEYMGMDKGEVPQVKVRASLISPDDLPRKTPREQLDAIQEEIYKRGYSGEYLENLQNFWEDRVENEEFHDKDTGEERYETSNSFFNSTKSTKIGSWGPLNHYRLETTKDPVTGEEIPVDPPALKVSTRKMPALNAVWDLFYDHVDGTVDGIAISAADKGAGARNGSPSATQLRETMDLAMEAVGQDAAKRMDSCGSNPALAMSHLVGDLKTGKAIASGTEVAITSSFLKDTSFGAKTYLLEITSEQEYGKGAKKASAEYTTYRVFQKTEWEGAIENMTNALVNDLMSNYGVSAAMIAEAWPRDEGVEGRDEEVPGNPSHRYDPKKVIADPVFKHLPSTVGATMYPYSVANAFVRDAKYDE